jgi:hypothetical protein
MVFPSPENTLPKSLQYILLALIVQARLAHWGGGGSGYQIAGRPNIIGGAVLSRWI